ncbi:hypothetical protein Tco_0292199 [Tanacetum coccineum]
METAVEYCSVDKKYFDIQKKELSLDNDQLLYHIICQDVMNIVMHVDSVSINVLPTNNKCLMDDNLESESLIQENDHLFELLLSQYIVHICVNSLATLTNYAKMKKDYIDEYSGNLMLKVELAKKSSTIKISKISEFFKINEWQAKLDAKDVSIANLRKHIKSLKGKNVVEKDATPNKAKENPNILLELVEHARALRHLDSDLTSACKWKPTGRTFTIVGNTCPLTSITSTKVEPLKENTSKSVTTSNLEIKIYRRKTKVAKSIDLRSEPCCPNCSLVFGLRMLQAYNRKPLLALQLCLQISGYWLGYNLFSVGQFCDSDLEVAFRKHTCYIRDLEGVDLLKGSRGSNLYTLSLEDMMLSSPVCLLSNASKTKSWLWHRSSGLVPNPPSPTPYVPPTQKDWDTLFQPMFDEYFNPPPSVVSPVPAAAAPRPADLTSIPFSTTIDQDAPSPSTSQTPQETQYLVISPVLKNIFMILKLHI